MGEEGLEQGGHVRIDWRTHRALSTWVGASRESVSKMLKLLAHDGLVREEGEFFFVSPAVRVARGRRQDYLDHRVRCLQPGGCRPVESHPWRSFVWVARCDECGNYTPKLERETSAICELQDQRLDKPTVSTENSAPGR